MAKAFPENTFVAPQVGPLPRLAVGEAAGEQENLEGRPFCGGAGKWLEFFYRKVGIDKNKLNIINTIQCQPPGNVFPTEAEARSYISKPDAEKALSQCMANHILPFLQSRKWERVDIFGGKALEALTGRREGINKWRGSPMRIPVLGDKYISIPTIHPAAIARDQSILPAVVNDLRKGLTPPPEFYNPHPSLEDVRAFDATEFAFDIEVTDWWLGRPKITMVGLSHKLYHAMVVPFEGAYVQELKRIFQNARSVIGHNSIQFDLPLLEKNGVKVSPECERWDTMLLQHLRFPDLPHDLEFVGSQLSSKPAWKHDKAEFEIYCARDVDVTLQCFKQLRPMVEQAGLLSLYQSIQVPLSKVVHHMSELGVRIDPTRIEEVREKVSEELAKEELLLPTHLRTHTVPIKKRQPAPPGTLGKSGKPVKFIHVEAEETVVPWASSKQVGEYLYRELGLEEIHDLKTDKVSTGKMALDKLYNKTKNPSIRAIKNLRKKASMLNLFAKEEFKKAGTVHTHYSVHGTASGRLSSSDPNLQNITEAARCLYVPRHTGWSLIDVDYSGIENRLTAYFANDTERMQRFLSIPDYSEHKQAASVFFNIPYDEVEKDNDKDAPYGKAKRIVHGCVPGDHEVLTRYGWIRFDNYDFQEEIATWHPDHSIEFERPLDYVKAPWEGNLYHLTGRSLKASFTPEHTVPVLAEASFKLSKRRVSSLPKTGLIPLAGDLAGDVEADPVSIQLAVAIQADGWTNSADGVQFLFKRKDKIQRLLSLLKGRNYTVSHPRKSTTLVSIPSGDIADAQQFLDFTSKTFRLDRLLALTRPLRKIFLAELLKWDGGTYGSKAYYWSTNLKNCDIIQAVAHTTDTRAYMRVLKPRGWGRLPLGQISFGAAVKTAIPTLEQHTTPFKGLVYCVTTSSGYFILRHEGRVFISGNSNYGMGAKKISMLYDMDFRETKELLDKWKKELGKTVEWQNSLAAQAKKEGFLTTPFGRKRWFYTTSSYTESLSFLPQSAAADVIFRAMLVLMHERISWPLTAVQEVAGYVEPLPKPANLLLQVHDSLILECPDEMIPQVVGVLKRVLEQPWRELGGLVLPIGIAVGKSWGETEKYRGPIA